MYNIQERVIVIADGFAEPISFLRDDETIDVKELQEYFDRSWNIFESRLATFRKRDFIDDQEERELRFMLEALLAAKHLLIEEKFVNS
jgi:hypothetical protein